MNQQLTRRQAAGAALGLLMPVSAAAAPGLRALNEEEKSAMTNLTGMRAFTLGGAYGVQGISKLLEPACPGIKLLIEQRFLEMFHDVVQRYPNLREIELAMAKQFTEYYTGSIFESENKCIAAKTEVDAALSEIDTLNGR